MSAPKLFDEHSILRLLPDAKDEPDTKRAWLNKRPAPRPGEWAESKFYLPKKEAQTAVELALRLGAPLLVTGEPGSGKTQLAFYVAWKLGLEEPLRFQVRSASIAKDLLYAFDTIGYFRSLQVAEKGRDAPPGKETFFAPGPLLEAMQVALRKGMPCVLLIDEIDKAPRDFPNDLLHELDQLEVHVPELDHMEGEVLVPWKFKLQEEQQRLRPLVIITSNSEHRLPEAFLRRCVYHHVKLEDEDYQRIIDHRIREGDLPGLSEKEELVKMAIKRFLELRRRGVSKPPGMAELQVWLRMLASWAGADPLALESVPLVDLPFKGLLLKRQEDLKVVEG